MLERVYFVDTFVPHRYKALLCRYEIGMRSFIKRWGNSAAVRVPAAAMQAAHLTIDQQVDIRVEEGKLVIEPLRTEELGLDDLLAGVTPENIHDEIDFGPPVGREQL